MEYLIKIVIVCARKVGWARQRNRRVMTYKLKSTIQTSTLETVLGQQKYCLECTRMSKKVMKSK